jgi:hypothetical protein
VGGLTVMMNDCGTLVFWPPPAVPPLSCSTRVMVADPIAPVPGVYVSVPLAAIVG